MGTRGGQGGVRARQEGFELLGEGLGAAKRGLCWGGWVRSGKNGGEWGEIGVKMGEEGEKWGKEGKNGARRC